jgi:stage V sporulation protein G
MEITDVRVKLIEDANDRLKAVCSVTFDEEFVVRDVKVVEGTHGLFVAMPSRKLSVHCPQCRHKNHLRARHCNECGAKLPAQRVSTDANGRLRLHRDIAHPINPAFREMLQGRVIQSFESELEASKQPGYRPAEIEEETEETAEPIERTEPVENGEGMTEYDALIAGLRTGGPPRSEPAARPSVQARPPAPRQTQRPSGPRRSDARDRSDGRPQREPRPERPAAPARPAAREPVVSDDYPLGEPEPYEPPAEAAYVQRRAEEPAPLTPPRPAAPARPSVAREPRRAEPPAIRPAPPPPAPTTTDAEDLPFGAGLV